MPPWSRRRIVPRAALAPVGPAACVVLTLLTSPAEARRTGIISPDCVGCHVAEGAVIDVTASPAAFAPGDDVTFTVTVRRMSGTAAVGGVSIGQPATGTLHTIGGEGLTLVADAGLTHSQPKQASGGVVTFRFGWLAPSTPGGVVIEVGGLAGDGNGRSSGDVAGTARFLSAFGCEPIVLYADLDRDGHGTDIFPTSVGCAGATPPEGYATAADDCNDNDQNVSPSASELCNKKDDDCDAEVDEDAELIELWPDLDGDGYYQSKTGTSVIGCSGMAGYGALPGDCAPNDPAVHAGATETCNLIDDNCDGRYDERLRPQCGVGSCRRESYDCDVAHCTPGEPKVERCNYLDDDCNGEVDDGELCAAGSACLAGKCVVTEGLGGAAGGAAAGSGGGTSAAGQGSGGTSGATSGTLAGGGSIATSGAGGTTPSSGGASGSSDSGSTGGGSLDGSPASDPETDAPSGCALDARRPARTTTLSMLLALFALLLHARRRHSR